MGARGSDSDETWHCGGVEFVLHWYYSVVALVLHWHHTRSVLYTRVVVVLFWCQYCASAEPVQRQCCTSTVAVAVEYQCRFNAAVEVQYQYSLIPAQYSYH